MSKKEDEPVVEGPQVEDDESEESDDYDIEDEEEEEAGGFEEDDEGDEEGDADDAALTQKGDSLTALLLAGAVPGQEVVEEVGEEEDEDEEYTPAPEITGPATSAIAISPPPAIGRKRSRDERNDADEETEDLAGDYGETEENSEAVTKKARAAAEE